MEKRKAMNKGRAAAEQGVNRNSTGSGLFLARRGARRVSLMLLPLGVKLLSG